MAETVQRDFIMKETLIFFNTAIAWGGGEKWHFEVAQRMHAKGYKVCVLCHPKSELFTRAQKAELPHQTISISNVSVFWPGKWLQLFKILKSFGPTTLIINLSRDLKIGSLVGRWINANRIIYRRGSAISIKNTLLNRWIFGSGVDEILANSQATKTCVNSFNSQLFPEEKIRVIYNGLDFDRFKNIPKESYYQRKSNELVLTHLGRLETQKNQTFLLDVAAELKQRAIDFHLIIGGAGRLESKLKEKAEHLQLLNNVSFVGFVEQPEQLYYSGDLFLLPSLWEGFGFVIAEAGSCKKPVIAFDLSSNPEIIVDGKTGRLTPAGDLIAFCDAIQELEKDREMLKQMGKKAHDFVTQNFDKEHIYQQIETYLKQEK